MKVTFNFIGRQSGAIGITYQIQDSYNVQSVAEAKSLLYMDYTTVTALKVSGCDRRAFDKAEIIPVSHCRDRKRDPKTHLYIKPCKLK